MSSTLWTVQVREGEVWHTPHEGERFVEAVAEFNGRSGVRRLLRNGRPLAMEGDHPDLFETGPDNSEPNRKESTSTPVEG